MTELSQTPFAPVRVDVGAGTLVLHPQRFGDIGVLADAGPADGPIERLRRFFGRIGALDRGAASGEREAPLDSTTLAALSDADIERAAQAYLAMPDVRAAAHVAASTAPDVVREPGESAIGYLD